MPKPSDYIKKGWCQGSSARYSDGITCNPESLHAEQWCLHGSVIAAYQEDFAKREGVCEKVYDKLPKGFGMAVWNDDPRRTQQQVIKLLESIGE